MNTNRERIKAQCTCKHAESGYGHETRSMDWQALCSERIYSCEGLLQHTVSFLICWLSLLITAKIHHPRGAKGKEVLLAIPNPHETRDQSPCLTNRNFETLSFQIYTLVRTCFISWSYSPREREKRSARFAITKPENTCQNTNHMVIGKSKWQMHAMELEW